VNAKASSALFAVQSVSDPVGVVTLEKMKTHDTAFGRIKLNDSAYGLAQNPHRFKYMELYGVE